MIGKAQLVSAISILALSSASLAATETSFRRYADSQLRQQQVPGAAIAVIRDGKVLQEIVYGVANRRLKIPVRRSTLFQLASVTKVFTAVTLIQLQHDGLLSLDSPLSQYLPDLPEAWRNVTLRELANHTSGLPDVIESPNRPLSAAELLRSEDDALQFASSQPVLSAPGEHFKYDQTNYLLLRKVIERVSHQAFRDVVKTRILKTRMPDTRWGDSRVGIPARAAMYTALHGAHIQHDAGLFAYPEYLQAAAGLNSNIADMEQFAEMLTHDLSPSELAQMWAPAKNHGGTILDLSKEMGLTGMLAPTAGWFYADNSNGDYPRVFMAGGSAVSILVFPKQRLCIVVLTNLQAKDDPVGIAENIAKRYIPGLRPML